MAGEMGKKGGGRVTVIFFLIYERTPCFPPLARHTGYATKKRENTKKRKKMKGGGRGGKGWNVEGGRGDYLARNVPPG